MEANQFGGFDGRRHFWAGGRLSTAGFGYHEGLNMVMANGEKNRCVEDHVGHPVLFGVWIIHHHHHHHHRICIGHLFGLGIFLWDMKDMRDTKL